MIAKEKRTKAYDAADFLALGGQRLIHEYLEIAWKEMFEQNDPAIFVVALGNVARAKGMTEVARDSGMARESIYRSLEAGSKVRFETIFKLMAVFNFAPVASGGKSA